MTRAAAPLALLASAQSASGSGFLTPPDPCIDGSGNNVCSPLDVTDWTWNVCDYNTGIGYANRQAAYCRARGGTYSVVQGSYWCEGHTPVHESTITSVADRFIEEIYGSMLCTYTRTADTGWGWTGNGAGCWSGPDVYSNGVLTKTVRRMDYEVKSKTSATGQCTVTSQEPIIAIKSRSVLGCPNMMTLNSSPTSYCSRDDEQSCPKDYPVKPGNGAKVWSETDYVNPSSPLLRFERSYDSSSHFRGFLTDEYTTERGIGDLWHHSYSIHVVPHGNSARVMAAVRRPDGNMKFFDHSGNDLQALDGVRESLQRIANAGGQTTGWVYLAKDDRRETFDAAGKLLSIEARGGERVDLSYDSSNRLERVVDRSGRTIRFGYKGPHPLIDWVELPDAAGLKFAYDASGNLTTITLPGGTTRKYAYASGSGRLSTITGEDNLAQLTYEYYSDGRLRWSKVGGTTNYGSVSYTYTKLADGRFQVRSTYPGRSEYMYFNMINGVSKLTSTTNCTSCGGSSTLTYDAYGNRNVVRDLAGVETDYDHDARGLLTRRVDASKVGSSTSDPNKRTTETDWHATFALPVEMRLRNAGGIVEQRKTYSYNARGQLLTQSQIDPVTNATRMTTYTYCEQADVDAPGSTCPLLGLRKTVDGPRTDVADVTTFAYYASTDLIGCDSGGACRHKGDLHTVTNALGHVTEYVRYDRAGRVLRTRDPNGVVTDTTYHVRGWPTSRIVRGANDATTTDDAITTIDYYPTGLVQRVTQPDGAALTYTYDAGRRLTRITDNAGNSIRYTLDAAGNRVREQTYGADNVMTRALARQFDAFNKLTASINAPHATATDLNAPSVKKTTHTYDVLDNADKVTDPLGRVTDSDYDPLKRLVRTIQDYGTGKINATTQYAYDARDNLRQVTDAKSLNTIYTYDGLNNLTQLSSPDTGVTRYTHDAAGNRRTQTDSRGVTTTFAYDALNRLTSIRYPAPALDTTIVYDVAYSPCGSQESFVKGRPTAVNDQSGQAVLCYDRHGNMVRKTQTVLPVASGEFETGNLAQAMTLETRYSYTLANRIASIAYPGGGVEIGYTRDSQGRITAVTRGGQQSPLVSQVTYLPFGPPQQIVFGNGDAVTHNYDANYWTTGVFSSAIQQHYSIDDVGNIISLSGIAGGTPDETYDYDAMNRIASIRAANQSLIESYTYDSTGNRTSKTKAGATASYGYDPVSHRLTSVGTQTRSYDANGNWTTIDGRAVHTFDDRNRLIEAGTADYNYNARGQRVLVDDQVFSYDETGQLLAEFQEDQQVCPQTCPPDTICEGDPGDPSFASSQSSESGLVEEPVCPAEGGGTTPGFRKFHVWLDIMPVAYIADGVTYNVHADQLNTPRALTTSSTPSRVVWRWDSRSNAFGESAANADPDGDGTPIDYDLRFAGQYNDRGGRYYNYLRDYEPSTGRYVESDPIGLRGGMSTYAYVASNPLMFADPLGLLQCLGGQKPKVTITGSWEDGTRNQSWECVWPNGPPPACKPNNCDHCRDIADECKKSMQRRILLVGALEAVGGFCKPLDIPTTVLNTKTAWDSEQCDRDQIECERACEGQCR